MRTNPSSNIGLHITNVFGGHGTRSTLIASPDMDSKNADLRPRLSLSCHGDQADPNMVFKRTATKLAPASDATKVDAPWPKGLHDESWVEHAKLPDSFWMKEESDQYRA